MNGPPSSTPPTDAPGAPAELGDELEAESPDVESPDWSGREAQEDRPRVKIANRADGGIGFWVGKLYGFALLVIVAMACLTCIIIYSYFSITAPSICEADEEVRSKSGELNCLPGLDRYATIVPGVSRMYAADGTLVGEFYKERRQIVAFERIPKQLVDAFLAVEDHRFFEHRGIYFKGIARALWKNITAGDFAQGGSTITQQVAKQFIGGEKSLSRKGKEAIVARRLELLYSKRAILAVYLNHIFLGAGSWGVAAAAQRYFGKDLDQLTLAECAMLAGLAKAPTRFSPLSQPKNARERRDIVLDKMLAYGMATRDAVAAAKAEPIRLTAYQNVFPNRIPYYADHVKTYVTKTYGDAALDSEGLRIETAAEPTWEAAAYDSADYGARHQDKRQGWRGPEWRVDGPARDVFLARQKQLYGDGPLTPGRRYLALVDKVNVDGAELLVGERRLQLPLRNMKWASKWQRGNADNDISIESARDALKPGDIVWVAREIRTRGKFREYHLPDLANPTWLGADDQTEWEAKHPDVVKLEQVPHPQTTIFTADHNNAYVVAMAGGSDYDRSQYNRAVHKDAPRQPGSTYKPIYYSLALDQGFGFDTQLDDMPIEIVDPVTGEVWTPTNLGETLDGDVTLEYALVFSKNIPSVDLFRRLGAKNVEAWARRLGFTTKIFADDALALGASASYLHEMARAFTVFARNGAWWPRPAGAEKEWIYVRRIVDREGTTLEDNTLASDPQLAAGDRFDRVAALAGVEAPQAIAPRTAYLMSKLLAAEVIYGFANVLRATQINAAGKTGTSSDTHDTMFIAYTNKFTTLVWMGDDQKVRAIGKTDAAYKTVVPLWSRYMYQAAKSYPNPTIPWMVPKGVRKDDRGDHSKGEKVDPPMPLIWKPPPAKTPVDGIPLLNSPTG